MSIEYAEVQQFKVGTMKLEIHSTRELMGEAAARAAAEALKALGRSNEIIAAIFATGVSQLDTLEALTKLDGLPWSQVRGFHLDEYIGLPVNHVASFRGYLRRNLTSKVRMREFLEVDGTDRNPEQVCRAYAKELRSSKPQLCLLGIGENGHLAFNDPGVADFNDPEDVKVVKLDAACRTQQAAEGWFKNAEEVPEYAISLTIPTMMRVPKLIVSVPGSRKAQIMRRTLEEVISTDCPATILRTHPDVTVYLDRDSASQLGEFIERN
jgi:glucosamine-6-phosphate deaminase